MELKKVKAKIRKLLEVARLNAGVKENESRVAAGLAAELIIKYNIGQLGLQADSEDQIKDFRIDQFSEMVHWRAMVLSECGTINNCVATWKQKGKDYRLLMTGQKADVRKAVFLYRLIIRQMEEIGQQKEKEIRSQAERRRSPYELYLSSRLKGMPRFTGENSFANTDLESSVKTRMNAFYLGMAQAVAIEISDKYKKATSSDSNALVVFGDKVKKIENMLGEKWSLNEPESPEISDMTGFFLGAQAAKRVSFGPPTAQLERKKTQLPAHKNKGPKS